MSLNEQQKVSQNHKMEEAVNQQNVPMNYEQCPQNPGFGQTIQIPTAFGGQGPGPSNPESSTDHKRPRAGRWVRYRRQKAIERQQRKKMIEMAKLFVRMMDEHVKQQQQHRGRGRGGQSGRGRGRWSN